MVEGAGSVRDGIFAGRLHFAERLLVTVGDEDRIIAETVAAARRPNDMTVNFALEQLGLPVRPGKAQHRDEVGAQRRAAPGLPVDQFVVDALHGDGEVAFWPRPVGRVDARRPAQRVDLDAAVVGQGRQAGALGGKQRLQLGVAFERRLGLRRLGEAKLAGRHRRQPIRLDQLVDLPHLARVVGGDDEAVAALQPAHHSRPFT